ncbi:MAG: hypothetical protein PG980_000191 [Wolbachia endosymbiont of Ctenocephalides felis wCfeJ]|nr:MAG: hypothetical protein PG980_000191 [Wolbachia endosymbiont of Ctenocephalides felis wCfeJ]
MYGPGPGGIKGRAKFVHEPYAQTKLGFTIYTVVT